MPDLVPIQDAAAEAGVDRTTLYRLIWKGELKKYRGPLGDRRTYIDRAQLRRRLKPRPDVA